MSEIHLIYVAREKPLVGRAPPLQVFHTLQGLCMTGPKVTYITPWPEKTVRSRFVELIGRPAPANLSILSLGAGPSIPLLARRWPTLWWSSFRRRLHRALARLNQQHPRAIVYTRNRNVASELSGDGLPPVVFECHEFRSRSAAEIRDLPIDHPEIDALRAQERRALSRIQALVTLTQCLADDYRAAFPDLDLPMTVIPDGVDPDLFAIPEQDRRPVPGRFIYVGSLLPWKGLHTALRALAKTPRAELHLCGGKPNTPDWNGLLELAGRLNVFNRITLHGALPQRELGPLLATGVAGILPLDGHFAIAARYTSPLKLFEYLCAGLPVLATDLPSIREIVTHEREGLLFPDRDADALADAMTRMMDESELSKRLSEGARVLAAEYTWQRRGQRIWNCCRDALPSRGASAQPKGIS